MCRKCEYRIKNKVIKMMNEENTHQFLMRLNDETLSTTHSQVLAFDPLPSIDIIFNMVTEEENHKKVTSA